MVLVQGPVGVKRSSPDWCLCPFIIPLLQLLDWVWVGMRKMPGSIIWAADDPRPIPKLSPEPRGLNYLKIQLQTKLASDRALLLRIASGSILYCGLH